MKKRLIFYTVLAAVGALPLAAAPRDLGAFSNVRTSAARMPFYKNKQLEFYLRSSSLVMRGKQLEASWPLIDAVRKGISVETVSQSDNGTDIYALNASLKEVADFWSKRAYSEGLVLSESALLDQVNKVATGQNKVFLRSPMLDLNGVGFTADFTRKIITVNSNVEIVIRNNGDRSLGSSLSTVQKKPDVKSADKTAVTRAYCNELTLDNVRNMIILTGDVRVFDTAGVITSERLEIEFGDDDKGKKSGKKASQSRSLNDAGSKLKVARFVGKVHAVRKLDAQEAARGEQYADADLAVYTAAEDTLELTGSRPRLVRGRDYAEAERIVIHPEKKIIRFFDRCEFKVYRQRPGQENQPDVITADYADWNHPENLIRLIGRAHIVSPADQADMQAARLEITLADDSVQQRKGGDRRPKKIAAAGRVMLKRNNNGVQESAWAGRMTYESASDEIVMRYSPILRRGDDIIRGGKMTYKVGSERLIVNWGSHIELSGATVGSQNISAVGTRRKSAGSDEPGSPVVVDSKNADLYYGGNLINFTGAVAVRGRGMSLDSDKLDIFLEDTAGKKSGRAAKGKLDVENSKKPVRALAVGNVHAEDKSGSLDSQSLDVYFGDKAEPGKTDIEKIIAGGGMLLQNKPAAEEKKSDKKSAGTLLGNSADGITSLQAVRGVMNLLTHKADFYEKVVISDSSVKLECEHLEAFARRTQRVIPSIASYQARDEFPDQLAVGEGRELIRIVGNTDVKMSRTLPSGEVQRARGDRAVYTVRDRKVVMTCDPPKRPQAVTADSGMIGDKVSIDLDSEELFVENGDVLTRTGDLNF